MTVKKFLRLVKKINLPYLTATYPTVISAILAFCSIIILKTLWETNLHRDLFPHIIALVIFLVSLPLGAAYLDRKGNNLKPRCKPILDENDEEIEILYRRNETFMYGSWLSIIIPLGFAVLCFGSITIMAGLPWGFVRSASFAYKTLLILVFAFAGSMGWQFFCFEYLLEQISEMEIKGEPFQSFRDSFFIINSITISVVLLGVIIYIFAIFIVWLIPWGKNLLFSTPFGTFWAFPFAIIALLYFLIGQNFIRKIIKKSKEKRIKKIEMLIEANYEIYSKDFSEGIIAIISELIKWREIINRESEGALNLQTSILIISSILIPAFGTLIDLVK